MYFERTVKIIEDKENEFRYDNPFRCRSEALVYVDPQEWCFRVMKDVTSENYLIGFLENKNGKKIREVHLDSQTIVFKSKRYDMHEFARYINNPNNLEIWS